MNDLSHVVASPEGVSSSRTGFARQPTTPLFPGAEIKSLVAAAYGVSVNDLESNQRGKRVSYARHVGMWLMTKVTVYSLPSIAGVFNKQDHTTVIFARRKIDRVMSEGGKRAEKIRSLYLPLASKYANGTKHKIVDAIEAVSEELAAELSRALTRLARNSPRKLLRAIYMAERNWNGCLWLDGDPMDPEQDFCGLERGRFLDGRVSSYCQEHHDRVYKESKNEDRQET